MVLEKKIKLQIEKAREELDRDIGQRESSEIIYSKSLELDQLIEDYIMLKKTV